VREVIAMIRDAGAEPAAVVIGLNRQERGEGDLSAVQELEQTHGLPVLSIIGVEDIIAWLESGTEGSPGELDAMRAYRARYGV